MSHWNGVDNRPYYPRPGDIPEHVWWCPRCGEEVPGEHVTYEETHDPRYGGCGGEVY